VIRVLGVLVNPVAGLGGTAGLKGSDGPAIQAEALARGASPRAGLRAGAALAVIARHHPGLEVLAAGGPMGGDAVTGSGLRLSCVYPDAGGRTDAEDTVRAARALKDGGADLIAFAGGDGTARDIARAVGTGVPVLGIPAGVKMYSSCFAVSPVVAGYLLSDLLAGRAVSLLEREVLDIDEADVRAGAVRPRLYASVAVPVVTGRTQGRKIATPATETAAVRRAAAGAVHAMQAGTRYLLGPGGTTSEIARLIGVPKTPVGVDVVEDGRLVASDADERQLLAAVTRHRARAVVSVIGGQGFVLGRGNQQISALVLRAIGADPLLVVATEAKLAALSGRSLLIDTGDPQLDAGLSGYQRVITGPESYSLYRMEAPERA
jgi:predicted polyphosphate/ATP-dependent NAD kinase